MVTLALFGLFGLAVGSFLNVVIVRVPAGESLLVRASLVGIEEEEHRARIHQRVVTGTADDPEALDDTRDRSAPFGR